ncbi:MAG: 4Fe-4S cluster-binding domain-containing protein, partial [Rhodocyclaceae bacterium]|nr:4Fe-4S cluster-binding domain-containing protein [Rhodocyclaceae bacterium]
SQLKEFVPEARILITVAAIKDVVELLHEQGFDDWIAAGPLLEKLRLPEANPLPFAIETCILCHTGFLHPERAFLRSIDLIITERCSLKCHDCANLMQYYTHPQNVDFNLLTRSIDQLCASLDEMMEMRIIGGDALMNKEWHRVVAHALEKQNILRVIVYTNGAIVPSAKQAPLLQHPKVLMLITDYGDISCNMNHLKTYLTDHRIAHQILHVDNWLDCASLNKHHRTPEAHQQIYKDCCAKNMLSLSDGKLFRCPFAANAHRLQAAPDIPTDYVDIFSDDARHKIMNYVLSNVPLSTCDFCNGRPLSGQEVPPAVQINTPRSYTAYSI